MHSDAPPLLYHPCLKVMSDGWQDWSSHIYMRILWGSYPSRQASLGRRCAGSATHSRIIVRTGTLNLSAIALQSKSLIQEPQRAERLSALWRMCDENLEIQKTLCRDLRASSFQGCWEVPHSSTDTRKSVPYTGDSSHQPRYCAGKALSNERLVFGQM